MAMYRICLITPHHVSFQPRALREADLLYEVGHDVRVVCRQVDPMLIERDERLMQSRKWRLQSINLCRQGANKLNWFIESVRSKVCKQLFDIGLKTVHLAIRSYVRGFDQLVALATSEQADWFIAHTQGALPIAATAARCWKSRVGFDCEDLLAELGIDPPAIVRLIEKIYLPLCDYVSVPSQYIANQLKQEYKIESPLVLYNVFPSHFANRLLPPIQRPARSVLHLYWFGQTLGPGRGIEDAIEAMGLIGQGVVLHLRGRVTEGYRSRIETIARNRGINGNVIFHSFVDYSDLISAMDQFDIGLALERPENANASKTVSNKLFSYLLAGLAIAATDTHGQREVLTQIPSVGFLYPAGNPKALAEGLQRWQRDYNTLRIAQQAAWDEARKRYCWDIEKEKFLNTLERTSNNESKWTPNTRGS